MACWLLLRFRAPTFLFSSSWSLQNTTTITISPRRQKGSHGSPTTLSRYRRSRKWRTRGRKDTNLCRSITFSIWARLLALRDAGPSARSLSSSYPCSCMHREGRWLGRRALRDEIPLSVRPPLDTGRAEEVNAVEEEIMAITTTTDTYRVECILCFESCPGLCLADPKPVIQSSSVISDFAGRFVHDTAFT